MFPSQGEIGFVVVVLTLSPISLVVTIPTFLAKPPLVRFVGLVAGHTSRRRITVLLAGAVAIHACDFDVVPGKGEFGHVMVKCVRIQPDDVRFPALMLAMAILAVGNGNVGNCAVEAASSGDIFVNVFVAEEA